MVRFENDSPLLAFTPYEYRDSEFYAGIEEVLERFRERPSNLSDADKHSLGLYYLVNWILDRGGMRELLWPMPLLRTKD